MASNPYEEVDENDDWRASETLSGLFNRESRIYIIGRAKRAPHLGCSIEISRDIYIMSVCMYVYRGPKSVGGITWAKRAHAQSQYWAVKSDQ